MPTASMVEPSSPPRFASAQALREACRGGRYAGPTGGLLPENVLCNLVVLPKSFAYDFLVYCTRNAKACPLVEVFEVGDPVSRLAAPGCDVRTDLSRYAVSRDGIDVGQRTEITDLWDDDSVAFLMGSSLTFDHAMQRAGVPASPQVWVLRTTIQTVPAGRFAGPLIVTMRWMTPAQAIIATQVTGRFTANHGAPLHLGDPAALGVDLENPIWGDPVEAIPAGVVPVFWACGVTPQFTALAAKPPLMVTHAPAHGLVTDLIADQFCVP